MPDTIGPQLIIIIIIYLLLLLLALNDNELGRTFSNLFQSQSQQRVSLYL